MKIAILILSAGHSTRMGTTKQLLSIGSKTLLGLCIENAIQSNANKTYGVLGANAKTIKDSIAHYNLEIIINSNYNNGLSSSIVAGIQHIINKNYDAVLITLGDQPMVDAQYLNTLIFSSEKSPTQIIASQYNEALGVPAIFPKNYFNHLLQLKGDKGAKQLLTKLKSQTIAIKSTKLIDIDTKQDYLNFLKTL